MAAIRRKHGHIAVACCESLLFCNIGDYCGWQSLTLPQGKDEKGGEEEGQPTENTGNRLLALAFSPSGRYLAACDDQKQLHLYQTGQEWTRVSSRSVVRRGKSVTFTKNEEKVLLADKSGDVHVFSVLEPDRPGELTHGHLSMVLDMVMGNEDQYVITCDRDEKIRVSNFPNSYNIYSFCLGHTEFVTSLCFVEQSGILLSGSGDLTIRSWNLEGKQLSFTRTGAPHCTDQQVDTEIKPALQKLTYCSKHKLLVVGFHGYPCIEAYQVTPEGDCSLIQTISLSVDPWDIFYDETGILWVLQPLEGSTLQLYTTVSDGNSLKLTELKEDERLLEIKNDLNSMWSEFKGCLETKSIVPTLWKQRVDNMSDYLKRKEERLTGTKSGGDNSMNEQKPPEKVAKLN